MTEAPWIRELPPKDGLPIRSSARLIVINPLSQVLLFRFAHNRGPLKGQVFWATPGGGLEPGESFEQAAVRELEEETGFRDTLGPELFRRHIVMQLPTGDYVVSDERYFLVRAQSDALSNAGWTALEKEVMAEHRWWSRAALVRTDEIIFPDMLADALRSIA